LPEVPTLTEIAEILSMNSDYFSRAFKRTTGQTVRTWLSEERVRAAALRLRISGKSISEVAEEYGFSDAFSFSKRFKKVMHLNPSHYRRQ
jgi:AraC-like DNA-binding protein